jgi:hypothetical protein
MALFWKCTLFFRNGKQGSSESWHRMNVGGTDADRVTVENDVRTLANLRGSICGLGTFLAGARISYQDVNKKRSRIINLDPGILGIAEVSVNSLTGYTDTATRSADVPTSAIQFRMYSADGRAKNYWQSWPPDAIMRTNPDGVDVTGSAVWLGHYNTWRAEMKSGKWGFRARTLAATDPYIDVLGLSRRQTGLGVLGAVVNGAPTIPVGQSVQLRGFIPDNRAIPQLNGIYTIDNIDTTSLTGQSIYFLRATEQFDPDAYKTFGTIQRVAFEAVAVNEIQPYRQGRHKRGRPFGQQVGRRSKPARLF